MGSEGSGPLWVVTSFFNPTGSRNRLENYRAFRRLLRAPLLTVELAVRTATDPAFAVEITVSDVLDWSADLKRLFFACKVS